MGDYLIKNGDEGIVTNRTAITFRLRREQEEEEKYDIACIDGKNVRIIDHGSSQLNSSISKVNDASYVQTQLDDDDDDDDDVE